MDKICSWKGRRERCTIEVSIRNGEIVSCYYATSISTDIVFKDQINFYEILKAALQMLIVNAPEKFMEVYKSLFLSSREYKIAKTIKNQEIARLESTIRKLQI